ncbi:hypothetical protein BKA80DRAFT_2032 [Phyllosticta citrichinensis]
MPSAPYLYFRLHDPNRHNPIFLPNPRASKPPPTHPFSAPFLKPPTQTRTARSTCPTTQLNLPNLPNSGSDASPATTHHDPPVSPLSPRAKSKMAKESQVGQDSNSNSNSNSNLELRKPPMPRACVAPTPPTRNVSRLVAADGWELLRMI